jgi:anti-sigma B factor antagonist
MHAELLTVPEELTILQVRQMALGMVAGVCSGGHVRVDLSTVTRIDTAGIQLLLVLKREALRTRTHLEFVTPSAAVTEVMQFCQAEGLFDLPPSE